MLKTFGWNEKCLPPGMKRRNPGTKKMALETPAETVVVQYRKTKHRA